MHINCFIEHYLRELLQGALSQKAVTLKSCMTVRSLEKTLSDIPPIPLHSWNWTLLAPTASHPTKGTGPWWTIHCVPESWHTKERHGPPYRPSFLFGVQQHLDMTREETEKQKHSKGLYKGGILTCLNLEYEICTIEVSSGASYFVAMKIYCKQMRGNGRHQTLGWLFIVFNGWAIQPQSTEACPALVSSNDATMFTPTMCNPLKYPNISHLMILVTVNFSTETPWNEYDT